MEAVQLKEKLEGRNQAGPVFDASGDFERCGRCGDIHLHGWSCYHCTVIKRMSRRGFVNPLNQHPKKYLASTSAKCKHCRLPIPERTRGQLLHTECKAIWQDRKRRVFRTNQLLWFIRKKGYYTLDGNLHSVEGLTDEAILVTIGQILPEDVVCVKKPGGGFRFRGVSLVGLATDIRGRHGDTRARLVTGEKMKRRNDATVNYSVCPYQASGDELTTGPTKHRPS
jgi:hypothetical protein